MTSHRMNDGRPRTPRCFLHNLPLIPPKASSAEANKLLQPRAAFFRLCGVRLKTNPVS